MILALVACAAIFGPIGPSGQPDPTIIDTEPTPDFFFLWIYAALALLPAYLETLLLLTAPVVAILFLLVALPLLAGTGEKSWRRRPVAVLAVVMIFLTIGSLTYLGTFAPWSPVMDAWSGAADAGRLPEGPLAARAAGRAACCRASSAATATALGGEGGLRGPALDDVATRLTRDQLIRQVLQGGGNMPAYGKNLSPAEVTALVAFLATLHPAWPRARARRQRVREALGAHLRTALAVLVDPPRARGTSSLSLVLALELAAIVYVCGWLHLRARRAERAAARHLGAFFAGLGTLFLALASPLDTFADRLLAVHMAQHLLLLAVAPPLIAARRARRAAAVRPSGGPRARRGSAGPDAGLAIASAIRSWVWPRCRSRCGAGTAGGVRARAALAGVARGRARELSRCGAALLVARGRSRGRHGRAGRAGR